MGPQPTGAGDWPAWVRLCLVAQGLSCSVGRWVGWWRCGWTAFTLCPLLSCGCLDPSGFLPLRMAGAGAQG